MIGLVEGIPQHALNVEDELLERSEGLNGREELVHDHLNVSGRGGRADVGQRLGVGEDHPGGVADTGSGVRPDVWGARKNCNKSLW